MGTTREREKKDICQDDIPLLQRERFIYIYNAVKGSMQKSCYWSMDNRQMTSSKLLIHRHHHHDHYLRTTRKKKKKKIRFKHVMIREKK